MFLNKKYIMCSGGIYVCYLYFGIFQEKITRSTYGENDEFVYSCTLAFIVCVISTIIAKLMLHTLMKSGEDPTRQLYYTATAISYLSAMVTSNMALRHVNYPTQVISKSCKPIPVMILGVLISKNKYPWTKYVCVLMIVIGICLFMYKDKSDASSNHFMFGTGEILLLLSLSLDGFIGVIQDRMRVEHQSKPAHMMYNINLWSIIILAIVILITGEVWSFMQFVEKYPHVLVNIIGFSVTGAVGQIFIYVVVSEFGPLSCSIITTSRKFLTVLGSVFLFGNVLTSRQWFATSLVFTGLALDSVYGKKKNGSNMKM